MRANGLLHAALALSLILLSAPWAHADEPATLVPENCWPMRAGGPLRSGASRTKPPRGPLHVAWTHTFKGQVVGEPLVWDDTVIVEARGKPGWREIHMLDLVTGKSRGRHLGLKVDKPLLPSLWRRQLALRTRKGITVYRVGSRKLTRMWEHAVSHVSDVHLVDGVVTWATGGGVSRREVHGRGHTSLGAASVASNVLQVRGTHCWLTYDAEGNAHWGCGSRGDSDGIFIGHHKGKLPPKLASAAMAGGSLFLKTALPLPLADGGQADTAWLRLTPGSTWALHTYLTTSAMPCGTRERWVAQIMDDKDQWELVLHDAKAPRAKSMRILASSEVHPELLRGAPLTMSQDMLYVGNARIDLKTYEIHEPLPVTVRGRVVPARDCILVRTRSNALVCLRGEADRGQRDVSLQPAAKATGESPGKIVAQDGRIKNAALSWAEGVVLVGGKPLDPERVLLARAGDGTIAHAGSVRAALEGIRYLIEKEEGKVYATLATDAIKALNVPLAKRCVACAELRGAGKSISKWTRRRIAELEGTGGGESSKAADVAAVCADEDALVRRTTDLIWASFEKLAPDAPWSVRAEMLRAIFERLPAHEGAVTAVRAAIPEGVPLPPKFDGTRWLLLADAVQADPVTVAPPNGPDRAAIEFARRTWRRDVIGLRSRNLLILTPQPDPAQVGACLALGELVCRTLEDLFGASREGSAPLVLHLFESQKAYLKAAGGMGHGPSSDQTQASVGHYSPRLNISRIFLPAGEDPFEAVYETYAHELVHHWIQARCPLPRTRGIRLYDQRTPGFWLVEGIAELFAEFEFDLRRREVRTSDPRAASLDTVAHAPASRLIAWPSLLTLNQATFARLKVNDVVPVPMRWRVGLRRQLDQTGVFYSQSAATAQYLFHSSDKARAVLVDLVRKYYEGSLRAADLKSILGLTPEQLGAKVLEYARR